MIKLDIKIYQQKTVQKLEYFVPVHGVDWGRRGPGHARASVVVADGLDGGGDDAGEHAEDAGHRHRGEAPLDYGRERKEKLMVNRVQG